MPRELATNWLPDGVDPVDVLNAAFKLRPAAAIAYFMSLGLMPDWNWRADATLADELGFSIAKVADLEVLAAVKDEVMRALQLGITQRDFREFLAGRLSELGWYGARDVVLPDGSTDVVDLSQSWRMNVIFRTNTQSAYMAGRYEFQISNIDSAPFGQYTAVLDERTRETHAEMHGRIYRLDDPIWKLIYPPCGYNCRCRVIALAAGDVDPADVRDGNSDELPDGFPDPGFGNNGGIPGAFEQNIAAAYMRANAKLYSPPSSMGLGPTEQSPEEFAC